MKSFNVHCSKSTVLRHCRILISASVSNTKRAFVFHTIRSAFTTLELPVAYFYPQIFVIWPAELYSKTLLQLSPHSSTPVCSSVYSTWKNMTVSVCSTEVFHEVEVCLLLLSVGHPSLVNPVLLRNLILLIHPVKWTGMESAKCCSVDLKSSFRCFFMVLSAQ